MPHVLLSHQRELQIGGPVLRLVKRTIVNVFTSMKQHVVVEINEVIVGIDSLSRVYVGRVENPSRSQAVARATAP
jgi:hypothetical protein